MKLLVAVPAHREKADIFARQLDWFNEYDPHLWPKFCIDTTQGLDSARSSIIDKAKALGADRLVMMDGDVLPEVGLRTAVSVANEDLRRGYAAVLSPARSNTGELTLHPTDRPGFSSPFEVPADKLFEVGWGSLSFGVYDATVFSKLKALEEAEFTTGKGVLKRPLYCLGKGSGEDHSLCDNLRASTGLKIGSEPRLLIKHMKLIGQPSWRPELRDMAARMGQR